MMVLRRTNVRIRELAKLPVLSRFFVWRASRVGGESVDLRFRPHPRATCGTDLQERFPSHVIDTWLGHSLAVAEAHYLQTTDAHWERAITEVDSAIIGGVITADPDTSVSSR